jgi:hypothetical protein
MFPSICVHSPARQQRYMPVWDSDVNDKPLPLRQWKFHVQQNL